MISNRHVITAAHCVTDLDTERLYVADPEPFFFVNYEFLGPSPHTGIFRDTA